MCLQCMLIVVGFENSVDLFIVVAVVVVVVVVTGKDFGQ